MADDIYDYFSGNAPKKLEPIEDDDFDGVDEPAIQNQADSGERQPTTPSEPGDADLTPAQQVEATAADQPTHADDKPAPRKSDSHWDFLAGILGIKREPKESPSDPLSKATISEKPSVPTKPSLPPEPVVKKTTKPTQAAQGNIESGEPKSGAGLEFFGFDPIPSPEDETILKSMFHADRPSEGIDLFGADADASSTDDDDEDDHSRDFAAVDADDGDDYLEFEIEELDDSPYREGEAERRGRRSRRRAPSQEEGDHQGRSPARADRSDYRSWEDSASSARKPNYKSGRSEAGADEHQRDDRNDPAEDRDSGDAGSRSKRRRRSRGRGRDRKRELANEDALPAQDLAADALDDDLVDEIGWVRPTYKSSEPGEPVEPLRAPSSRKNASTESTSDFHADEEFDDDDLSDSAEAGRPRRRRSRRRGKGGRRDGQVQDGQDERQDESLSGFYSQQEEDAYDHANRSRSAQRPDRMTRMERDDQDTDGSGSRFPTWAEAISSIVEANIKNHSQSGRGRGGNGNRRGRGRSR